MGIKLFCLIALLGVAFGAPKPSCSEENCKPPNCRCSSTDVPGGFNASEIPQLVILTFDDAVTISNMPFYEKAFKGRKNPDGCPISTTYFVSHEYTDYSKVQELHAAGHEIALHSISHEPYTEYWAKIGVPELVQEFGGEKELISYFADIPKEDIKGIRLPLLQMSGDNSFEALKEIGLEYDCSWPTVSYIDPGIWPYTLDFASNQDCPIGPCPKSEYPGIWVFPMIDLADDDGFKCAMADSCTNIPDDAEGVYQFMLRNFEIQYEGNKAPFGFYVHASWFLRNEAYFEGYLKFIEHVQTIKDAYIVNIDKALQWVKNPSKHSEIKNTWPKCQKTYTPTCTKPTACQLMKGEEIRYMTMCAECPDVYPWLGNPLGEEQ